MPGSVWAVVWAVVLTMMIPVREPQIMRQINGVDIAYAVTSIAHFQVDNNFRAFNKIAGVAKMSPIDMDKSVPAYGKGNESVSLFVIKPLDHAGNLKKVVYVK
jgi:hypothetical protein